MTSLADRLTAAASVHCCNAGVPGHSRDIASSGGTATRTRLPVRRARGAGLREGLLVTWLALLGVSGCSRGTASSWSHANPQHEFVLKFDPLSHAFSADYFSNDGQEFRAKNVHLQRGDANFDADEIGVTDKSVENRTANGEQIKETTKQWDRFLTTLDGVVERLAPGLNSIIGRAPPQPSLLELLLRASQPAPAPPTTPAPASATAASKAAGGS